MGATSEKGVKQAAEFYESILGGGVFDVRSIKSSMNPKFSLNDDGSLNVSQVPLGSVTIMRSIRDAEAVKAMENTVRDVNIGFVNELAKISDVLDLDVVDIIDGMATKPFGKGPFYPVGVGGHCIAVDPEWLKAASKKAGYMPEMIQLARSTNDGMPEYTVSLLQNMLNERGLPLKGTQVLVFWVLRTKKMLMIHVNRRFMKLKDLLEKKGANVDVFDSWIGFENTVKSLDEGLIKS